MKILLIAVNAKYIHSNLAVHSLKAYSRKYGEAIETAEFTINNQSGEILEKIYKKKPDIAAFSCYIWNISIIRQVAEELKKVLPNVKIWFGGPEVSYDPVKELKNHRWLSGVMIGEGEETFRQLAAYYIEAFHSDSGWKDLDSIQGIAYRDRGRISCNRPGEPLSMDALPFPYEDLSLFQNKILYYETSRGCPYSCSYCLSSIEKGIRLRGMALVEKELQFFLDYQVPQVKFIDRTFNCNHEHAMAIWSYIHEHDNGYTNFHFEISADLLREDEIWLLNQMRPGLIQLEIGVQTVHPMAIKAIRRRMNLEKLAWAVKAVARGQNIHQHLDLIAGLPYEDYASFRTSFDYVYRLRPDQLQLGFLKVLKGSAMYEDSKTYHILYGAMPPYEVLATEWLSYDDILRLKRTEEMVEIYYNSGQFVYAMAYLEHFYGSPFDLYQSLGAYYEQMGLEEISHSRIQRYKVLLDFYKTVIARGAEEDVFSQILVYDLYLRDNLKSRPDFAADSSKKKEQYRRFFENKDNLHRLLPAYKGYNGKQISRMVHLEYFSIDIEETVRTGKAVRKETRRLFDYAERSPLNHQAAVIVLEGEQED